VVHAAFVFDAIRTPRGKGKSDGSLHEVRLILGFSPSSQTTPEGLAKLKPPFEARVARAWTPSRCRAIPRCRRYRSHTPGNSSGIVDGAALVLVGSEAAGRKLGMRPRARIVSVAITGTEPTIMLTGPAPASYKALAKAGMTLDQIDLFEVNEAFASVVLRFQADTGVPWQKINVNGGAIALGHPLGATGAMLLGTLVDELERRQLRYGLCTLCVGGGMGIATIVERT
jgi:acetyl-CoA C-acetyltransferase